MSFLSDLFQLIVGQRYGWLIVAIPVVVIAALVAAYFWSKG